MRHRLHQSLVMATQPWWELLPVSWALRLQMSRIWVGLKTVWYLGAATLVWCLGWRKRWRSAVLVASAGAWLYSGQKDLGEISWSAGQVRATHNTRGGGAAHLAAALCGVGVHLARKPNAVDDGLTTPSLRCGVRRCRRR